MNKKRDHNMSRREQYSADAEYREVLKVKARKRYRDKNPKRRVNKLMKGVLAEATKREVTCGGVSNPFFSETYSIREASVALGRSLVTINRYIDMGMLPPPVLFTTSHGYRQYDKKEVQTIAKLLAEHAVEFDYFHSTHTDTVTRIHIALYDYRKGKKYIS